VLGILVRLGLLAAVLGIIGYAAYLYLPSATVVLRPNTETAGPIRFEVTADPSVAVADSAAALIPADRIEIPLSATDEFDATGRDVTQTRAEGIVRFRSENTLFDVPIAEGTRLSTASGTEFDTVESIVVPRASFETGPTTVETRVRAVRGGPDGNVDADTITDVPESVSAALVAATNPAPTSGGSRVEAAVVTRRDYDDALQLLEARLADQLAAALGDPATTPRGLVLFAETGDLGRVTPDQAAGDLVDTPAERFTLTAETIATVLAVNEDLIDEVAADRLADAVAGDHQLFAETVSASHSEGDVRGDVVVYDVTAQGEQYRAPDPEDLLEQVRGRKLSEARAILQRYGSVEITPWPDFVDTLPDQIGRISLSIVDPDRRDP
jgi:hypothetical protein